MGQKSRALQIAIAKVVRAAISVDRTGKLAPAYHHVTTDVIFVPIVTWNKLREAVDDFHDESSKVLSGEDDEPEEENC